MSSYIFLPIIGAILSLALAITHSIKKKKPVKNIVDSLLWLVLLFLSFGIFLIFFNFHCYKIYPVFIIIIFLSFSLSLISLIINICYKNNEKDRQLSNITTYWMIFLIFIGLCLCISLFGTRNNLIVGCDRGTNLSSSSRSSRSTKQSQQTARLRAVSGY
jgi:NADH:ubiquinone oxidoreductase subunit 6 (subunit J)